MAKKNFLEKDIELKDLKILYSLPLKALKGMWNYGAVPIWNNTAVPAFNLSSSFIRKNSSKLLTLAAGVGIGAGALVGYKSASGQLRADYNPNYPTRIVEKVLDGKEYAIIVQRNNELSDFLTPGQGKTGKCRGLDELRSEEIENINIEYRTEAEKVNQECDSKIQKIKENYGAD